MFPRGDFRGICVGYAVTHIINYKPKLACYSKCPGQCHILLAYRLIIDVPLNASLFMQAGTRATLRFRMVLRETILNYVIFIGHCHGQPIQKTIQII